MAVLKKKERSDTPRQRSDVVPLEIAVYLGSNVQRGSVQNLLSSRFLSKNLKTKIYRTKILPVVLHGCETWSSTLREERKLRVFENMVLRRIFGPRRNEVTGNGGDCITRS